MTSKQLNLMLNVKDTRAMYVSPRVFYFLHSGRMFCAITHAEDIWLR